LLLPPFRLRRCRRRAAAAFAPFRHCAAISCMIAVFIATLALLPLPLMPADISLFHYAFIIDYFDAIQLIIDYFHIISHFH
jgi:hypothetical protein